MIRREQRTDGKRKMLFTASEADRRAEPSRGWTRLGAIDPAQIMLMADPRALPVSEEERRLSRGLARAFVEETRTRFAIRRRDRTH